MSKAFAVQMSTLKLINWMFWQGTFSEKWAEFKFSDSENRMLFLVSFDLPFVHWRLEWSFGAVCASAVVFTVRGASVLHLCLFSPEEAWQSFVSFSIFSLCLPLSFTLLAVCASLRGKHFSTSRTLWCLCWGSSSGPSSQWVETMA